MAGQFATLERWLFCGGKHDWEEKLRNAGSPMDQPGTGNRPIVGTSQYPVPRNELRCSTKMESESAAKHWRGRRRGLSSIPPDGTVVSDLRTASG